MKVAVIGIGNVGVAIATDLSINGHDVDLIKTSERKSEAFDRLLRNNNRVYLKENTIYTEAKVNSVSKDLGKITDAEVVIITIQSTYHEDLIKRISQYLNSKQVVLVICSYMSSFYFSKYCLELPMIAEATGPYLEGRVELNDKPNEVVFRVGCRLTRSPLSVFHDNRKDECMENLQSLYKGFSADYSVIESALLNPNMVLHTVGAIMSIPRIEFSDGNFCMYREAYSRKNKATLNIMEQLDKEKMYVLDALGGRKINIYDAGGFLGKDPLESFYKYSESSDRAISPTSIHSRYITEDVSQGLVLLEDIALRLDIISPVTSALISLASAALGEDFRSKGRTLEKLGAYQYIQHLKYQRWEKH
ncbi:NAD/NADP-dependent octopine/nopaline dehydrogenase family protein [Prevotella sp. KH2C16]|uniref:NAD/NADP-dependent octopine/nopaline dehydrogenase family protein n=1 Tax=Prevotella sp. KH2C16 TaxID=1855325 RepID=UPI0008EB15A2|nr:NAD/NADP-dependent octopine/nopaline dehydrogenase family protein [Prevotella sp. KH2C16]SFG56283.1 ketopantoate reductase [Prevotella sp. KH2C16]